MRLVYFLIILLLLIICMIKWRNKFVISLIIIIGVCMLFFYKDINVRFKAYVTPSKYHTVYDEEVNYNIPLPPKTTFLFRTSDSSAQYACFSDIESIINFYQNKEGIIVENTLIHNNELKIKYKNEYYLLKFKTHSYTSIFIKPIL